MNRFELTIPRAAGVALLTLAIGHVAAAQSRQVPAPAQSQPVVVHSAHIHTVGAGTFEPGYVAFAGGLITHVGRGAAPEIADARVIDGSGLHVYPGLIGSDTRLGLVETGAVDVTHDHTEHGDLKPEVRSIVAVNPDSDLIPVTRANGILSAMVFPSGGLVSGRPALIRLDGWTWEQMAIDGNAGLLINWPRVTPVTSRWMNRSAFKQEKEIRENLAEIDRVFDDALAYVEGRANDPTVRTDLRYEAMRPVLDGDRPVFVRAASAAQIESAVAWAVRRGFSIVIVGGAQSSRVLPLLKKHDVPVIVGGLHRMPAARHIRYDEPFTLPAELYEAGVRFAIASGSGPAHERNLNHNAATAAAYGLPKDIALRAVTLAPAEIFGQADRLGSIEVGKAATLIVTTGDPLEIVTDTLLAFIDGRAIDLGSRHKTLYAKYREKYRQLGVDGQAVKTEPAPRRVGER
ncbi:MAG: amidohydrolase family protein [Phycisphaerales bacterium]|nr:amidohydrolase family protein [Phycisphaerales bacterium]